MKLLHWLKLKLDWFFSRVLSALLMAIVLLSNMQSHAAPFKQGGHSFSLGIASSRAFDNNYTVLSAGLGYYLIDGLELGMDLQSWFGSGPSITKLSPKMMIVFNTDGGLKPYFGAFYSKTRYSGFEDLDAAGARAGVYLSKGAGYYMRAGLVYENELSCKETEFVICSETYPEINFTFML